MAAVEAGLIGTFVGILIGLIVGYYKARAEAIEKTTEALSHYVKQVDCVRCTEMRETIQQRMDDRIDEGTRMFAHINQNIAVILQRLDDMKS